MRRIFITHSRMQRLQIPLALIVVTALAISSALVVSAAPQLDVIVLPGASSTDGIAAGRGATFFAGDLFRGDIFRGNLQHGTVEPFIHAPAGRMAVGMKVDDSSGLLFVAGGTTGQAYVYDTNTGAAVTSYQLANPAAPTFINMSPSATRAPGLPTALDRTSTWCQLELVERWV